MLLFSIICHLYFNWYYLFYKKITLYYNQFLFCDVKGLYCALLYCALLVFDLWRHSIPNHHNKKLNSYNLYVRDNFIYLTQIPITFFWLRHRKQKIRQINTKINKKTWCVILFPCSSIQSLLAVKYASRKIKMKKIYYFSKCKNL